MERKKLLGGFIFDLLRRVSPFRLRGMGDSADMRAALKKTKAAHYCLPPFLLWGGFG